MKLSKTFKTTVFQIHKKQFFLNEQKIFLVLCDLIQLTLFHWCCSQFVLFVVEQELISVIFEFGGVVFVEGLLKFGSDK